MVNKVSFSIIIGFILIIGAIVSSIILHFYFWYTFYLVGAFMLFGSLNYKTHSPSVYSYILKRQWKPFFVIYGLALLIGLVIDIIYGRTFSSLWYYPHLDGFWNFFFPVFLYYPFGAFQVYEIFQLTKSTLKKYLPSKIPYSFSSRIKEMIINFLIVLGILGIILPILNYYLNNNIYRNELMVLIMICTPFFMDALVYKLNKQSIFLDFLQGNPLMIAAMIIGWFVCAFLTEFPNTYSWEWIYTNIPFVKTEFLKVNLLIFTFGWFFLVFIPVRFIDLIKEILKRYYE